MKKLLILVVVIGSLFITGCTDEGVLKILNNSLDEIWYELDGGATEWLDSNWEAEYTWDLDSSIFGSEDKKVTVKYGGGDQWWWDDYEVTRTVKPGKTVRLEVKGDAGEIAIWNNSTLFWIEEVYLSPSSDLDWGDDDLIGDIWPDEIITWKVTTGYWDVRIIDDVGGIYESFDNYVGPEETITFEYENFKKSSNTAINKKANAAKYTEFIEDLCEQRSK